MKTIAPPAQDDAERHYRRGLAAMARNDFAAAEREFERAARKAPGDALYWVNLAQAIRKQGQPERALAAADLGLTLFAGGSLGREVELRVADVQALPFEDAS
ncbi:MAG: tetratricopeptide repeat protein, partial [Candidatus Rokubacteria bacterium]|nr:tetratricopeptide repeat protein [Candidatus Rokubacteria bacterium]